jgi:aminoglycoside 6'-N-acetyltransferase I
MPGSFTIEVLELHDRARVDEVARIMFESFRELSPTWLQTPEAARESVVECLEPEQFNRVLMVGDRVAGWVGARHDYGFVWELHPLVVGAEFRGRGYGRALVQDVEALCRSRGGLTMLLSTSDESARTSLFGRDLYADPIEALRNISVKRPHPLEFWTAVGYSVVGVVPDAEGPGMPSIMLAKRLSA